MNCPCGKRVFAHCRVPAMLLVGKFNGPICFIDEKSFLVSTPLTFDFDDGTFRFSKVPPPFRYGLKQWIEGVTKRCKMIFDPRWNLGIDDTIDDPILFQLFQLKTQHFFRNPRNQPPEFAESFLVFSKVPKNDRFPFSAYKIHGYIHGAMEFLAANFEFHLFVVNNHVASRNNSA